MLTYIVKLGYGQHYEFDEDHANTAIKFAEIAAAYRVEDDDDFPEVMIKSDGRIASTDAKREVE